MTGRGLRATGSGRGGGGGSMELVAGQRVRGRVAHGFVDNECEGVSHTRW